MRAAILSIALASLWPFAGQAETLKPLNCGPRDGCLRGFLVEGFHGLDARPVALPGNRIVLLGLDGLDDDAALWLIDPSVTDGAVAGAVEVEMDGAELDMVKALIKDGHPVRAEIAPDGVTFALFLYSRQGTTLRFFGASGKPMVHVEPPYFAPWPAPTDFEWTPVDLLARFAGMNALKFEEGRLRLGYAGLSIMADYETGDVTVVDTVSGDRGDLADILNPAFDPVGLERYWFGEGLAAATNYAADGFPAQLAILQGGRAFVPYAMPPMTERGDRLIDANEAKDFSLTFAEPILTPDGARLAVLRHDDQSAALVVYGTDSGKPVWSSTLPMDPHTRSTLVWSETGELVHVVHGDGGARIFVYDARP